MTALSQYERLESTGLWRAAPGEQRREVTVSFGDATLVIADSAGRPLTHWSLAAIERVNPGQRPAVFAPDAERSETLEVEDDIMIGAVETVRKTIARRRPRPGRLRWFGLAMSVAGVAALGFLWLPDALRNHTLGVVPPAKRSEIGATLLGHMQRLTGPSCRDAVGTAALTRLRARVLGAGSEIQLVVVPGGVVTSRSLPGGITLLNRGLVEDYEDPAVVAGYVLAELANNLSSDPLDPLLKAAGLRATITLLTTGDLPPEVLRSYAETLVSTPAAAPDTDRLIDQFARAEIAASPFAYAVDITGETTLDLIEADPMAGRVPPPILSDGDWVALQGICGG